MPGRHDIDIDEILECALDWLASPSIDAHFPTWEDIATQYEVRHDNKVSVRTIRNRIAEATRDVRTPIRFVSNKDHRDREFFIQTLVAKIEYDALLNRVGDSGLQFDETVEQFEARFEELAASRTSPLPIDEIIELARDPLETSFKAAYTGLLTKRGAKNGPSHRVRSLLMAHHQNKEIREALARSLDDPLSRYTEITAELLKSISVSTTRDLYVVVDDGFALFDGYLDRAILRPGRGINGWAAQFANSVISLLKREITYNDQ